MAKYASSDDGNVVDGKIVVFLEQDPGEAPAPPAGEKAAAKAERAKLAGLQAKALAAAAEKGVPFCAECEQARRELAAKREGSSG